MYDDDDGVMNDNDYIKQREAKKNKEQKERAKIYKDPVRISEELEKLNKKSFLSESDQEYKQALLQAQRVLEEKKNAASFSFNVFELRQQQSKKQKTENIEDQHHLSLPQDAVLAKSSDGRLLPVGGVGGVPLPPPKKSGQDKSNIILPKPPLYPPVRYDENILPPPPFDPRILQFPPPPPPIPLPTPVPTQPMGKSQNVSTDDKLDDNAAINLKEESKSSQIPTKSLRFVPSSVKHQHQQPQQSVISSLPLPHLYHLQTKLELPPATQSSSSSTATTSSAPLRKPILPPPVHDKN